MNKNAFAKELAQRLNCTVVAAKAFIHEYNNLITDRMQEGDSVKLQYFGVFTPCQRGERQGRNPQTGEQCLIEQRTTIRFKPSECIIRKINNK